MPAAAAFRAKWPTAPAWVMLRRDTPADVNGLGVFDRLVHRPVHRDGAGGAVGVEQGDGTGGFQASQVRGRVDLTGAEKFDISRDAKHAVAVDAAQVGPDQRFRPDRGVVRCDPGAFEDRSGEAGQVGGSDFRHLCRGPGPRPGNARRGSLSGSTACARCCRRVGNGQCQRSHEGLGWPARTRRRIDRSVGCGRSTGFVSFDGLRSCRR